MKLDTKEFLMLVVALVIGGIVVKKLSKKSDSPAQPSGFSPMEPLENTAQPQPPRRLPRGSYDLGGGIGISVGGG